jgi:transposase
MEKIRFVGLDVHKESITMAVADSDGGPAQQLATVPNDTRLLLKQLRRLGPLDSVRACYEAGPTGFGLCRALIKEGVACIVVAPSLIPTKAGDRVKTDRRDAEKLARFHRSGELTAIHVPEPATEAMRDLERARDAAKRTERTARHQISKFLLRHGMVYEGKTAWTEAHLEWIGKQKFEHEAQNRVLADGLQAVRAAGARVESLTKDIVELVKTWTLLPLVETLQALRGIQLLSAVILVAEIGNFARFASASEFMAYLGLVPSEHSTGNDKKRGSITRTGNTHVRRILTEAAWSYRYHARMSLAIRKRNENVSPAVKAIAWKAQHRLHGRYVRLTGRGKTKQQTTTAIARELAGFVWSLSRQPPKTASPT